MAQCFYALLIGVNSRTKKKSAVRAAEEHGRGLAEGSRPRVLHARREYRPHARHPRGRQGAHDQGDEASPSSAPLTRCPRTWKPSPTPLRRPLRWTTSSSSLSALRNMYKQRIRTAWGHAAHRGWTRLQLDRCMDLIDHGPRAIPQRRRQGRRRGAGAARRQPLPLP